MNSETTEQRRGAVYDDSIKKFRQMGTGLIALAFIAVGIRAFLRLLSSINGEHWPVSLEFVLVMIAMVICGFLCLLIAAVKEGAVAMINAQRMKREWEE